MAYMQPELESELLCRGASLVGVADLRNIPVDVPGGMPFGISIAAALDPVIVQSIINGPSKEYNNEYDRVNALLNGCVDFAAGFLREHGFSALTIPSTVVTIEGELKETLRTPLPHKTVATRAGLGWIGKNALVITSEYGSAVRFASVLTDARLLPDDPVTFSGCGPCSECIVVCPAHAPSGKNWDDTLDRDDFFDVWACYRQTDRFKNDNDLRSNICGMCIAACPLTLRYIRKAQGKGTAV